MRELTREDEMLTAETKTGNFVDRVMVSWKRLGKAKVDYSEDAVGRSRWRWTGNLKHKGYALQQSVDLGLLEESDESGKASEGRSDVEIQEDGAELAGTGGPKPFTSQEPDVSGSGVEKIVVAVSKDEANKEALRWAIVNFIPKGGCITLVHVRPRIRLIPTPLGNFVPVEQVSSEIAAAYIRDAKSKTVELLLDHQWICDMHKVDVDFVIVESDSVQKALVREVSRLGISKLIIGSSRNILARTPVEAFRKLRGSGIAAYVAKNAPRFCAVLVVTKGRLIAVREADGSPVFPSSPDSSSTDEAISSSRPSVSSVHSTGGNFDEQHSALQVASLCQSVTVPRKNLPSGVGRAQTYLPEPLSHGQFFSSPAVPLYSFSGLHKLPGQHSFLGPHGSKLFVSPFYDPSRTQSAPTQTQQLSLSGVTRGADMAGDLTMRAIQSREVGVQKTGQHMRAVATPSRPTDSESAEADSLAICLYSSPEVGEPAVAGEVAGECVMAQQHPTGLRSGIIAHDESVAEIRPATEDLSAEDDGFRVANLVGFTFNVQDCHLSNTACLPKQHESECLSNDRLPVDIQGNISEVEELKLQLARARVAVCEAQKDAEIQSLRCNEAFAAAALARQKEHQWATLREQEVKLRQAAVRDAVLAKQRAEEEARKRDEAVAAAEAAQRAVEEEVRRREEAEAKALKEIEARKHVTELLRAHQHYREYTYDELSIATNGFSKDFVIGEGGYGVVYKGKIHHTTVAIKVLNPGGLQGSQEFQREVELLRRIHHPHMVMLLGCCPDKGCLVYEYMANGSLEDCLLNDEGSTALPWHTRFRIAAEVATALLFLHSSKPVPIVHRDLKPANILLDGNFVSKVGDVGLAKLVPSSSVGRGYNSVFHRDTTPVGTFAYIDPEYQRTGSFGPKSDVYALGMVLLQLLTGRQAVGITEAAEVAIEMGEFEEMLDCSAGKWPLEEALRMARLALQCAEMKRKKRPELDTGVLPFLTHCRQLAEDYVTNNTGKIPTLSREGSISIVPTIFLCPILQEVMQEPVIAADGHTYDCEAITLWLEAHDTSPMTNLKLAHRSLTPNHAIRSAIREWQTLSAQ